MALSKTLGFALLALAGWPACGRVDQPLDNLPSNVGGAGASGGSGQASTAGSAGETASPNGKCQGAAPFQCLKDCNDKVGVAWLCQDGEFTCAPGTVPHTSCPLDTWGACWWKPLPTCYASCAGGAPVAAVCENAEPVCPQGAVAVEDCPLENCVSGARCCDPNGVATGARCDDATSTFQACPNGGHLTREACLPEGVTAKSCAELAGQACASPDYICEEGCTYDCSCDAEPGSEQLRWSCAIHPC